MVKRYKSNTSDKEEQRKVLQDKISGLIDVIASQTDEARASDTFKKWISTQAKFHKYSYSNALLIYSQCPEATKVTGFKKWKEVGRSVKKGEKAIRILAPSFYKKKEKQEQDDGSMKEVDVKQMYFITVPVFDISQTSGEDLPTINCTIEGEDKGVIKVLERFVQSLSIKLEYVNSDVMQGAMGCSKGGHILIDNALVGAERASVLAHEIAHELKDWVEGKKLDRQHSRSVKEIEAEAIAAVVLAANGIDTSNASFYLASWSGDSKKVKESLGVIASVSKRILDFFEEDSE